MSEDLQRSDPDSAIARVAAVQERHRAELRAGGIGISVKVPEVGRDIQWTDVIRHVFRVLDFDRAGTTIGPGNNVKAASRLAPYGYLIVESPIVNQPVRPNAGRRPTTEWSRPGSGPRNRAAHSEGR